MSRCSLIITIHQLDQQTKTPPARFVVYHHKDRGREQTAIRQAKWLKLHFACCQTAQGAG